MSLEDQKKATKIISVFKAVKPVDLKKIQADKLVGIVKSTHKGSKSPSRTRNVADKAGGSSSRREEANDWEETRSKQDAYEWPDLKGPAGYFKRYEHTIRGKYVKKK